MFDPTSMLTNLLLAAVPRALTGVRAETIIVPRRPYYVDTDRLSTVLEGKALLGEPIRIEREMATKYSFFEDTTDYPFMAEDDKEYYIPPLALATFLSDVPALRLLLSYGAVAGDEEWYDYIYVCRTNDRWIINPMISMEAQVFVSQFRQFFGGIGYFMEHTKHLLLLSAQMGMLAYGARHYPKLWNKKVEKIVDINQRNLLMYCLMYKDTVGIRLLIARKFPLDHTCNTGLRASDYAHFYGFPQYATAFNRDHLVSRTTPLNIEPLLLPQGDMTQQLRESLIGVARHSGMLFDYPVDEQSSVKGLRTMHQLLVHGADINQTIGVHTCTTLAACSLSTLCVLLNYNHAGVHSLDEFTDARLIKYMEGPGPTGKHIVYFIILLLHLRYLVDREKYRKSIIGRCYKWVNGEYISYLGCDMDDVEEDYPLHYAASLGVVGIFTREYLQARVHEVFDGTTVLYKAITSNRLSAVETVLAAKPIVTDMELTAALTGGNLYIYRAVVNASSDRTAIFELPDVGYSLSK